MAYLDEFGRPHPPEQADEISTLTGFLDYQRATFDWKCRGLDARGMNQRVAESTMTLGGMMKHLALVEDYWFGHWVVGEELDARWRDVDFDVDPDWEWRTAADDSPEELRSIWGELVERSRERLGRALEIGGLDRLTASESAEGDRASLRWVMTHMIEEYARHNGHADLIRESIDGQVGE